MSPALTKDANLFSKTRFAPQLTSYLVAGSQTIYKGALVMIDPSTGYLVVGADTAGCVFVGVADEDVVSTVAGVKKCKVASDELFLLRTESLTQAQAGGSAVYLLDSGTVALIATTVNDLKVGRIAYWVDSTHSWVLIQSGGTP